VVAWSRVVGVERDAAVGGDGVDDRGVVGAVVGLDGLVAVGGVQGAPVGGVVGCRLLVEVGVVGGVGVLAGQVQ
jgi:hypothetical protein